LVLLTGVAELAGAIGLLIPAVRFWAASGLIVRRLAFPDHARSVYAALQRPRRIEWADGIQIDFYDQEPHVTRAVALAVPHFQATLGATMPETSVAR
jgi:hypothetical protein